MVHDLAPQIFSHRPAPCLMSKSDLNLEYSRGRSQRTGIGRVNRPLNSIQPSSGDAFLREKNDIRKIVKRVAAALLATFL